MHETHSLIKACISTVKVTNITEARKIVSLLRSAVVFCYCMCRNNHFIVNKTPAEASKISDRLIAASDINNELSTINIHSTPSHLIVHAGAFFLSKWDAENKELVVVGDLNCDVSRPLAGQHTQRLKFLCFLYQLEQFINEPTRASLVLFILAYLTIA